MSISPKSYKGVQKIVPSNSKQFHGKKRKYIFDLRLYVIRSWIMMQPKKEETDVPMHWYGLKTESDFLNLMEKCQQKSIYYFFQVAKPYSRKTMAL